MYCNLKTIWTVPPHGLTVHQVSTRSDDNCRRSYLEMKSNGQTMLHWSKIVTLTHIYSWLSLSRTRLSRSENLVPVLTQRSTNRQQNIVEKRRNFSSFPHYFQYIFNLGVKLHIHSVKGGCSINCFPQFRNSDMSKYGYLEVFQSVPWS